MPFSKRAGVRSVLALLRNGFALDEFRDGDEFLVLGRQAGDLAVEAAVVVQDPEEGADYENSSGAGHGIQDPDLPPFGRNHVENVGRSRLGSFRVRHRSEEKIGFALLEFLLVCRTFFHPGEHFPPLVIRSGSVEILMECI